MLQLETIGSCTMVQLCAEVRVKTFKISIKEYVDIVNFNCYDIIIGMLHYA